MHKTTSIILLFLIPLILALATTETIVVHPTTTTTIAQLAPSPSASTTTITTRVQTTTTTTVTRAISPSTTTFSLPSILTGQTQNDTCTCLTSEVWCGTRSTGQLGLNGTCNANSLYMCENDEDQGPQEFDCTKFLEPIFGTQAGASCFEASADFNDVCSMPKNGTS
ncbi:hypothetical protein N431DRAFT_457569 [Stipitochalara longipes BDJ]|nr:hypothetical protein N431DRAFT_457569 [Stipitochalara longipes BDJ]